LFDQIGKNVQVYADDIVIKTKVKDTLIDDIRQTFDNLRRFRMKLNPAKYTFGVPASGWEWADPDLTLDLAPLAPRPILRAMGRPIF
jgi:hypothetical protein